jgi:hypothetical protein
MAQPGEMPQFQVNGRQRLLAAIQPPHRQPVGARHSVMRQSIVVVAICHLRL